MVSSPVPGENLNNDGIGRIYGGEVSARLNPSRRTTGFLSYTAARAASATTAGEGWRLFSWDQTHILTMAGSLRLGNGWDLSSTFRYVTGNPMTPVKDSTYNANVDIYRPVYGGVNSERNPAFHRLDLRIEKAWQVSTGSLAAYLDRAERLQPPEPGRPDPQLQLHPVQGHPRPAGHPQHRLPG